MQQRVQQHMRNERTCEHAAHKPLHTHTHTNHTTSYGLRLLWVLTSTIYSTALSHGDIHPRFLWL
jgi:hypothetical protein